MAYSFPPRGFPSPAENNQQFPPNFGWPPFPPPWQPPQGSPRPPWDYPAGPDRPPFPGGGPNFRPRLPGRFRGDVPRPSGLATGPRAAEPGAVPGSFPAKGHGVGGPRMFHHSGSSSADITDWETWPGVAGRHSRKNHQNAPGDGHQAGKQKKKGPHQNFTKGGPQAWKNQPDQPYEKTHRGCRAGRKKKLNDLAKQEKAPLEHNCDVCDRGFESKELLDKHTTEHVKCQHEGCKFEAHVKLVRLHIKMQHSEGSKQVAWMDTPAEISKWKEDRKRNYPSLSNMVKKAETRRSNEEKGAVLENKYFGKMRGQRGRQKRPNFQRNDGMGTKKVRLGNGQNADNESRERTEASKERKSETVTSSHTPHQDMVASSKHLGSLTALAAYGESSEEEEGEIKVEEDAPEPEGGLPPQKPFANIRKNTGGRKSWRNRKGKKTKFSKAGWGIRNREQGELQSRLKKRPNLLEMLLAPEIRKERNVILQCVRYVVQNDFLGVNQRKEAKQESEIGPPSSLEESVGDKSRKESRELDGSLLEVGAEESQVKESKEKTVKDTSTAQGSNKSKLLDSDILENTDEQMTPLEEKGDVLKEETKAETAQKGDISSSKDGEARTATVVNYLEERTDGTDVQTEADKSTQIRLDVKKSKAIVADGGDSVSQNPSGCYDDTKNANPISSTREIQTDANTNEIQGI